MVKTVIKCVCLLLMFSTLSETIAQNDSLESSQITTFKTISPRVGLGIHHYSAIEFGIAHHQLSSKKFNLKSGSYYCSFVAQQTDWQSKINTLGFKVGMHIYIGSLILGTEWKSLYHRNYSWSYHFYSPKIGWSFNKVLNLSYLHNISVRDNNFPINYRHQFILTFCLNKKMIEELLSKKK